MQKKVNDALLDRMKIAVAKEYTETRIESIERLLSFQKPKPTPNDEWQALTGILSRLYVSAKLEAAMFDFYSSERVLALIAEPKPAGVGTKDWERYIDLLRRVYYVNLVETLTAATDPWKVVSQADLAPLNSTHAKLVRDFAYRCELDKLPNVARRGGAERFLSMPKPDFLTERDYNELAEIAHAVQDVEQKEREVRLRRAELEALQSQTEKLKARVLRQLEIIEAFISDPDTLDGIEDYENAFAPRNLENLRRLGRRRSIDVADVDAAS